MNMKKISLIIPCYNAVSVIDICLQSVVNQTIGLENLEVILVNDASTDNTYSKLCDWEKRYEDSILVVNCSENGRQGRARNIGMQYATGEYVAFMDNDDIIEPDMYELLYQKATEHQCDVVVCQSMRQDNYELLSNKEDLEADELLTITTTEKRYELLQKDMNRAIWNKIYKREFLIENRINFIEKNIYDDIFFSELVKLYCKKIYITNRIFYHHVISGSCASNSLSLVNNIGYFMVHVQLINELRIRGIYDLFTRHYEELFFQEYLRFMDFCKIYYDGIQDEKLYRSIRKNVVVLFPEYYKIPLVQDFINNSEYPFYKTVLQDLGKIG